MIVHDYSGTTQVRFARVFIAAGLVLRVVGGLIKLPSQGVNNNEVLQSALARFQDLWRNQPIKKVAP